MEKIKTFYQLCENDEVICCIEGVLVGIGVGNEVCYEDKVYVVREVVDHIIDSGCVHRVIWLVDSYSYEYYNDYEDEY